MKKNIQLSKTAGLLVFCLALLFACKKDNGNIIYSQRPASKDLFLSISGTGNLNHTQHIIMLSTASSNTAVGLNLTIPASAEITAIVSVDTAQVKAYNAKNNTQFYLLPATSYDLHEPAGGLTIKAGSLFSADSLRISFKNLKGLRATNYLLPVSITKVSGSALPVLSDSVKTVYLNVTLTDVIQPTVTLTTPTGNTTSLTLQVGAKGAAPVTPLTIQISPGSPNNVNVTTAVDTSLVSKYGGGFTPFPNESYSLSASSVAINAGQMTANINVNIPDVSKFDNTKAYLLPVTISKVTGDDFVLTGSKTVYLLLNFNNLNNANNTSTTGTILSRQGWKVTATSYFDGTPYGGTAYPVSNTIDGNPTSDWIADYEASGSSSFIIDMGAPHPIKTIAYNKAYSNVLGSFGIDTYPSSIIIYTSSDGTNWVSQGTYQPIADQGDPAFDPGVNYINFYNAISARYVKLQIPYYTGFSEVYIYQ
ncbi:MAG: DUF1735 domain-containing protein [Bacteroidota bacterium]|nr:DUF1735 domain-containing protein [Bacteroidota bacterium]